MMPDRDRQAAAEIRAKTALDSIDEALRLVEEATKALSRVDGMIPEWERLASLCDRLQQAWFAVSAGANRLRRRGQLQVD